MNPPELLGRDRHVVQYVARFKQLASSQLHTLVFDDSASLTPTNRTLRRLVEQGYLARVEKRVPGGAKGGSGQYAYQLGRRGFYTYFEGRYVPARAVNYHALGIADCFIRLRRLERAGLLTIVGVSTEPDCWAYVGGQELRPDMYLELELGQRGRHKVWLEYDAATETQKQLRGKLEAYWRAFRDYSEADTELWPVIPQTVFVAVDDERVRELTWLISEMAEEARQQKLVIATSREGLTDLFS